MGDELDKLDEKMNTMSVKCEKFAEKIIYLEAESRKLAQNAEVIKMSLKEVGEGINGKPGEIDSPGIAGHLRIVASTLKTLKEEFDKFKDKQTELNLKSAGFYGIVSLVVALLTTLLVKSLGQ